MLCVLAVPPPHIYRLEGRRGSQGGAPSRRNPTWAPPNSASPFQIHPEGEGRRRRRCTVRVLNAEVSYVRHSIIGDLDHGEYDSVIHVHWNASAFGLRGYVDTLSPLVAMLLLDRSCVIVGFFLKYYVPQHIHMFKKNYVNKVYIIS